MNAGNQAVKRSECRYMGVVGTHAGNGNRCSECRYMVVGIVPLVHKGHPCRELNQHSPHHNHVPNFPVFPVWFQFSVGFNSLYG